MAHAAERFGDIFAKLVAPTVPITPILIFEVSPI
jgi:hypothetical protein